MLSSLFLGSCSSLAKPAPLEIYKLALSHNSTEACPLFTKLGAQKDFILSNLATIRAIEHCKSIPSSLKITDNKWLKREILNTNIIKYKKQKKFPALIRDLIRLSKLNLKKELKIEYVSEALGLAKKHQKNKVAKIKRRLHMLAPHLKPKVPRSQFLTAAFNHRKKRQFEKSIYYYQYAIKKPLTFNERVRAYRGLSKLYKIRRQYKKSLEPLKKMVSYIDRKHKKSKYKRTYAQKLINATNEYVRALWTYDNYTQAQNLLLKLPKKKVHKATLMESYWILGRMSEEKNEYQKAISWFEKALKQRAFDAELKEKIYWYLSWNLLKLKSFDRAIVNLKKLTKNPSSPYVLNKFYFWLAQAYKKNNQNKLYKEQLEELITIDPFGYYGFLAHHQLNRKIQPLASNNEPIISNKSSLKKYKFNTEYTKALLHVGEKNVASQYLQYIARKLPSYHKKYSDEWLEIFHYMAGSGDYLKLFMTIGYWPAKARKEFLTQYPEILFPQPFSELVYSEANKWKMSSNYIYSIMRQESSFNPSARSPVDAFGLLQMLPKVALKNHKAVGVPYEKAVDLYDPKINIPLGTYFLRSLWSQYKDQFVLATAAYNANDEAIKGWLKTRYKGDTLNFIEDIPYEETRNYIKLVLRNYIVYEWLKNDKKAIDFPAQMLEIKI